MREFFAVVERDAQTGLYVGYVPGLPGAHSQGSTLDEIQANMAEVVAMLLEDGEPLIESEFVGTLRVTVARAEPGDRYGDNFVDTNRSAQVYRDWLALARPADQVSPDGNRRPYWLLRPFRPTAEAYRLPGRPGLAQRSGRWAALGVNQATARFRDGAA